MYVLQEAKVKGGTLYVSRNKVLYSMLQKQKLQVMYVSCREQKLKVM